MNVPVRLPPPPELKEIQTKDAAGRVITTFEGSPSAWMRQFSVPPRRLVMIKTN